MWAPLTSVTRVSWFQKLSDWCCSRCHGHGDVTNRHGKVNSCQGRVSRASLANSKAFLSLRGRDGLLQAAEGLQPHRAEAVQRPQLRQRAPRGEVREAREASDGEMSEATQGGRQQSRPEQQERNERADGEEGVRARFDRSGHCETGHRQHTHRCPRLGPRLGCGCGCGCGPLCFFP